MKYLTIRLKKVIYFDLISTRMVHTMERYFKPTHLRAINKLISNCIVLSNTNTRGETHYNHENTITVNALKRIQNSYYYYFYN